MFVSDNDESQLVESGQTNLDFRDIEYDEAIYTNSGKKMF